uniref:HBS1-like protein n=1 Tax=Jaculus jaculus TaxID=51337 RepID=A0A8C5KG03_JACJA
MTRHRNVRGYNYDEDFEDNDLYVQAVEDNYCISPLTAAHFIYSRRHRPVEEYDYEELKDSSNSLLNHQLSEIDQALFIPRGAGRCSVDEVMIEAVLKNKLDMQKALSVALEQNNILKGKSERAAPAGKTAKGKSIGSQSSRSESEIAPKVAKMTVSGKKPTMGFEVPGVTAEENGDSFHTPHKGPSGEDANIASSSVFESVCKVPLAAPSIPAAEEQNLMPTPGKKLSKLRLQMDVRAELEKRQGGKQLLNLVVIGHIDAGKSTLMGHMLYLLGHVNKRTMHKYEQESKKASKASFAYAWVLDETGEERERGVTMDVGMTKYETKTKVITLMDATGHKDFIPNVITGAAQADVAALVVDASRGEFEAGFETGEQMREHGLLVRSLGVTQLAIASSDLTKWYKGLCLLEQIYSFKPPQRYIDKLCVSDVFKDQRSGFCVTGKIEAGYVQTGDGLLSMPPNETCIAKGITLHDEPVDWAAAGDHVSLTLVGMDINKINVGCIFCGPKEPIKACTRFRAWILIFNIEIPITKVFPVLLHYQTVSDTGEVTKKKLKLLTKGQNALVELQIQRPVALELYKDFKELGRFMLCYGGSMVAAGVLTEIKE